MRSRLLFTLCFISVSMGQPSFSEIILSSTDIDRATSVYAVDMDNDGDIDLVSGGSGDAGIGWVSWFENNGNESFMD